MALGSMSCLIAWARSRVCGPDSVARGQQPVDTAADQELGLSGEAGDLQPGRPCGMGDGAEVDIGGDVLQPKVAERVTVGLVAQVTHQGAHGAVGLVVGGGRIAVVDQQHQPGRQALG